MNTKLFQKDFTMVVIGQIISLFGNNILRYALPLYLLNITHSASLYGIVQALAFIPMLLLSPIGGIFADRVNKRNIMVCLDFLTALIVGIFTLCYQELNIVTLLIIVLMLLYGIQGAYQPTVQASIPILLDAAHLMSGNAIINMVNSLSGILGPVLGGIIFGFWGLKPVLFLSIVCFTFSAVMEIFIQIPFQKRKSGEGIMAIAKSDMKESYHFIRYERKEILKVCLLLTAINMVFSALIIIGLPIVINQHLGFSQSLGNQMYGYSEGALAVGGLIGALLSGIIAKNLNITKSDILILLCTVTLIPIGLALMIPMNSYISYFVILIFCMFMMIISTILSIEMITYVQQITPQTLIGKVMALLSCLVMFGNPIGQIIYGILFEQFSDSIYLIYFGAFIICFVLWRISISIFKNLKPLTSNAI